MYQELSGRLPSRVALCQKAPQPARFDGLLSEAQERCYCLLQTEGERTASRSEAVRCWGGHEWPVPGGQCVAVLERGMRTATLNSSSRPLKAWEPLSILLPP